MSLQIKDQIQVGSKEGESNNEDQEISNQESRTSLFQLGKNGTKDYGDFIILILKDDVNKILATV